MPISYGVFEDWRSGNSCQTVRLGSLVDRAASELKFLPQGSDLGIDYFRDFPFASGFFFPCQYNKCDKFKWSSPPRWLSLRSWLIWPFDFGPCVKFRRCQ